LFSKKNTDVPNDAHVVRDNESVHTPLEQHAPIGGHVPLIEIAPKLCEAKIAPKPSQALAHGIVVALGNTICVS
jgi:hypothetical protein